MPRLHFKGKVFVENHHLAVPFHELLPVRGKGLSEKASLHDNLVVHGDNLAGLKSLLPTYHGGPEGWGDFRVHQREGTVLDPVNEHGMP